MNLKHSAHSRIRAFLVAVMFLFVSMATPLLFALEAHAEGGVILKLHYFREDGNYAPWDVWLWPAGGEGAGYAFTEENGEMVATMEVPAGTTSIGYIVRTQEWTKDIDMDQFIEIDEVVSGTVHFYVKSGVEGGEKVYADDVVTGTKLKSAVYDDDAQGILLTMTGLMDEEQIKSLEVSGTEGIVEHGDVVFMGEFKYMLKLLKKLDLKRNYRLKYAGDAFKVNMPVIFSTAKFEAENTYTGSDLGATYSKEKTDFRVWAPTAEEVYLNRYESGKSWVSDLIESIPMTKDVNGTWTVTVKGDIINTFYTYTAVLDGAKNEACDPYARTTGQNGKRAMVIDLAATNPEGWDADKNPHDGEPITDAVIYELHVRDFSVDESSGMVNKGKYLAFTETGTKTPGGKATGVDYLKELGITHLHILPFYDFGSVDETKSTPQFNWGYDPVNYNVPEGSYATDAADGNVRVKEAKQMVKALHDNGISVVMDVVYNHVYSAGDFCVNRLVPGYFSRIDADGRYSNGSGCGNDTASERSMVRKYIVDSVNYWADEYHIDGFRFDLVGLIDVDTINEIVETVHAKHPGVIFYGEGWVMNTDVTKDDIKLATQRSSARTPDFAYFNDNIRDGIKGSVFNTETGFVSGAKKKESSMQSSFMAQEGWSKNPSQIINYASCHDNMTLIDRIEASRPDASREDLVKMNNLAAAIYLTAEGVPFMQAGEEILRTKVKEDGSFDSNSYASSDAVNSIKWADLDKEEYAKNLEYYKGLMEFRKAHPALRLTTAEDVKSHVAVLEGLENNVLGFSVTGGVNGEPSEKIFLVFNANSTETKVMIPEGKWTVCVKGDTAGTSAIESFEGGELTVAPISATILVKGGVSSTKKVNPLFVAIPAAVALAIAGAVVAFARKKKK